MEFTLRQVAAVSEAHITLNGITTLAGKNNTGKSTVSKSLWCMVRSLDNVTRQVERVRVVRNKRMLERMFHEASYDAPILLGSSEKMQRLAVDLARKTEDGPLSPDLIRSKLWELSPSHSEGAQADTLFNDELTEDLDRVSELADYSAIPKGDIARALLQNRLLNEFHGQINNIDASSKGVILLKRGTREFGASIENDKVVDLHVGNGLQQTAIYLDDPFVLDYYQSATAMRAHINTFSEDHRSHASTLLHPSVAESEDILSSIMTDKKIDDIIRRLDSVVSGSTAASRKHGIVYRRPGGRVDLDVRNISSGMKSFASIKALLHEDRIHEGDVLILDEPENHLHPQWQLVFAELIVLLFKAFNLRILLATHSPYFLRAIEVYSAHHEVAGNCRYYHAIRDDNGACFRDVTLDTDPIYEDMSVPFALLDDRRTAMRQEWNGLSHRV